MRRYPQFNSTPAAVMALPSVGAATTTVARRRYPQFGMTPSMVRTLVSLGAPPTLSSPGMYGITSSGGYPQVTRA